MAQKVSWTAIEARRQGLLYLPGLCTAQIVKAAKLAEDALQDHAAQCKVLGRFAWAQRTGSAPIAPSPAAPMVKSSSSHSLVPRRSE